MKQVWEGDWTRLTVKEDYDACCDCGLVHRVHYRIRGDRLYARVFRDEEATFEARRRYRHDFKPRKPYLFGWKL